MAKPDAWMPLYPGDYLADTRRLTLEQHGAYLLLILDYWRNGPPPDDEATLARIVGCTVAVWKRICGGIRPMFYVDGGVLRHKRIDAELMSATERKDKARAKAELAAAKRWGNATSNAPSIAQAMPGQCPSPSPSSVPSELKTKPLRRKAADTPIPDDFDITTADEQWAAGKGYGDLRPYLEIFVGRNRASGKLYANWRQAFRNAIGEDWYGLRKEKAQSRHDALQAVNAEIWKGSDLGNDRDITGEAERVA